MKTITNTTTILASLTLAAGILTMPVAAFAQQKAVQEYQQYLSNKAEKDSFKTADKIDLTSAIERLDRRVDRLETSQEVRKSETISNNGDGHEATSVRDHQASVRVNH